jgi:uncharacterized phage-associated protein
LLNVFGRLLNKNSTLDAENLQSLRALWSRADLQREKLLQTILFFVKNTRACHKLKLFKLLHFLDFKIYRETGRTVTGLQYFAWPKGPVPKELFDEFSAPRADMLAMVSVRTTTEDDYGFGKRLILTPRTAFDDGCFTNRELEAMKWLAEVFHDADSSQMSDASHFLGQPWRQVYKIEGKHQGLIAYKLALDSKPGSITKEQAAQIEEEAREVDALFG